jgi:hypothetical protein
MSNNDAIKKINEIYLNYNRKLEDILSRKKFLLKTYRSRLEEEKIREIKESIKNVSK